MRIAAALALALLLPWPAAAPLPDASRAAGTFHAVYHPGRAARLSLRNPAGSVRIVAWEQDEVEVSAVRRPAGPAREAGSRIVVEEGPGTLSIRTDSGPDGAATVDYTLYVPEDATLDFVEVLAGDLAIEKVAGDVTAFVGTGRLTARWLTGQLDLTTIDGRLEASFENLDASRSIALGTTCGDVVLLLPGGANARVKARSLHGAIRNDFDDGAGDDLRDDGDLDVVLGEGGARIDIVSVSGSIVVSRTMEV